MVGGRVGDRVIGGRVAGTCVVGGVVTFGGTVRVAPGARVVPAGVVCVTGALDLAAEDVIAVLVGAALVAREVPGPLTVIRRATTDPRPIPMLRTRWRFFGAG